MFSEELLLGTLLIWTEETIHFVAVIHDCHLKGWFKDKQAFFSVRFVCEDIINKKQSKLAVSPNEKVIQNQQDFFSLSAV